MDDVSVWDDFIGKVDVNVEGTYLFSGSISNKKISREIW